MLMLLVWPECTIVTMKGVMVDGTLIYAYKSFEAFFNRDNMLRLMSALLFRSTVGNDELLCT